MWQDSVSINNVNQEIYCNEGHDVVSAKDMHNTLKKRPVRGTTGSVCIVQEQNSTLEISKIANFNNLHNVEFTQ